MKIESEKLLLDLIERTRLNINQVKSLKQKTNEELNYKPKPETWSSLECIQHLNLYSDFYLPEIENKIQSTSFPSCKIFKAGILGDYFAKSMLPKEKLNKMKTFKDKNPNGTSLDNSTLDRFIQDQQHLLELLDKAREICLTKTKTSISISKWIRLRLGDTFRVVIYHNQRHIDQALKTV